MISVCPPPPVNLGFEEPAATSGGRLLLMALGGAAWLYFARPVSRFDVIDPEQLRETAKGLSPLQTWGYWEKMKEGLDRRTDQAYAAALLRFRCGKWWSAPWRWLASA